MRRLGAGGGEISAAPLSVSRFRGGGSASIREGWMWILAFLKMWYDFLAFQLPTACAQAETRIRRFWKL